MNNAVKLDVGDLIVMDKLIYVIFSEIQTCWRRYKAHSDYVKLKKAGLTLQCIWRGRIARKELRKLKMVNFESLKPKFI